MIAAAAPALGQVTPGEKVHARLIAERDTVEPGGTVTVALELDTRRGWHTYWRNPGEAGAATEIHWSLPPGWKAGQIQWPYPEAEAVGPIMDYGYEGKPWLLVDVTAPWDAKTGAVTLQALVNLLVCAEVCVPEDKTVALQLGVGPQSLPPDPAFAAARAKLPAKSPWPMRYSLDDDIELFVDAPALAAAHPKEMRFFPYVEGVVKKGIEPQALGFAKDGPVLRIPKSSKFQAGSRLAGVLVLTSADGSVQALDVAATPGLTPRANFGSAVGAGLAMALLFAFLGGLILNLMPCVLPVLAMKALALASHGGGSDKAAREGMAYGIGAILSFAALGGALILLRKSGEAIGWGFQLQEPVAVAGFALLIFAVGLNLSGVFELPGFGGGDALTRKGGAIGAFFTGVLAVAVAAPCTAPFMAAALGYALIQPAGVALSVFVALGLGFAAPFVAIGFSPRVLRLIPAPGVWMLRLKQALAFPMYAASVWLVWVLANEAGADAVAATLGAMVAFALAAWIWSMSRNASARGRGFGALAALLAFLASLTLLAALTQTRSAPALNGAQASAAIPHEAYSAERLAQLRRLGRPVFVNATAAWCITCLVNERVAFSSDAVRQAFATHRVAYLVADWTRRDPGITALLEAHGREGVPLYLYYAPGAERARILPQILTPTDMLKAIGGN
jgi:thiol:disulfide interchange protein DsbD